MAHDQVAAMGGGCNMSLASRAHAERCVAIVDPDRRSRRRVSSVVNRLGHMPVAFQDAQAMRAHGVRPGEFDLLLIVCPSSNAEDLSMETVEEVCSLVGRKVPVGLVTGSRDLLRMFLISHAGSGDDAIRTPPSREELHHFVSKFMAHHGIPTLGLSPVWGRYRFSLATGAAAVDGETVLLKPIEFDLAIALFRHRGRTLSREWLYAMVWGARMEEGSRALDIHVSRLRGRLGLRAEHGWMLRAIARCGYELQEPVREHLPELHG
ncbi:winged helix-turn-helix domain-containing protein [Variovorax sp. RT4R15]|uniref:winged helix-turn-helix domain-containing protein n=1 Tax=Variovorax sp. RT4R15 TaxID=3443737 RepID=UPI003F4757EB